MTIYKQGYKLKVQLHEKSVDVTLHTAVAVSH